jgi:hypothetical protein
MIETLIYLVGCDWRARVALDLRMDCVDLPRPSGVLEIGLHYLL